jgi:hypothetical protein
MDDTGETPSPSRFLQRSKSTPTKLDGGPRTLQKKSKPPNYPIKNQAFYKFGDENYTVGVVTMQGKR